jgi:complement component 1 Q subcomponent-binding protein
LSSRLGKQFYKANHIHYRQPQADEEGQHEDGQEHEEEQGMSENYCDFTIIISDVQGNTGLIVEATTMDTEVNYNSVMATDDLEHSRNLHRFDRQMKTYVGPDFSTLDERIQTSMTEYLEGFGVNEHLCAFVECMSLDKDQRLYMNWINKLRNFIQH